MSLEDDIQVMNEVTAEEKEKEKRDREKQEKDRRDKSNRRNDNRRSNERARSDRNDRGDRNSGRGGDNRKRAYGDYEQQQNAQMMSQMQAMQQSMLGMGWSMPNNTSQANMAAPNNPPLPPPLPRDPNPPPMPPMPMMSANSGMNGNAGGGIGGNNMAGGGNLGNMGGGMGGAMNSNMVGGNSGNMNQGNMMGMNNMFDQNNMSNNAAMMASMAEMMKMNAGNMMANMMANNGGGGMGSSTGRPTLLGNGPNMPGSMPNNMPMMNPSAGGNGNVANKAAEKLPGADELSDVMIGPTRPDEPDREKRMVSGMVGMVPTMDPNLAAAWGGWVMAPDGQMVRQPIVYQKSVLYPPSPNAPAPTLREKPPGCKTIFIGGVPEKADEEVIRDIFEKCGPIQTVRMSKKNFCHIRFMNEAPVANAILLCGWRLRVDNQDQQAFTGRIHVDYAQARDDLQDYERQSRQAEREERMRIRAIEDMNRDPSPPAIPFYSETEANNVAEDLKNDMKFGRAVEILETWLSRGDCNKRNADKFYKMILAANTHVKRLTTEKADFESELQRLKEQWKGKIQITTTQIGQIEAVFTNCSHQKVWDHFSKPQRKSIQSWKHQLSEVKSVASKINVEEIDAVELSGDDEDDEPKSKKSKKQKAKSSTPSGVIDSDKLKEESENWACQANAFQSEVASVKAELSGELEEKKSQIKILQQTLQGMQKQLIELQKKKAEEAVGPPKPKVIIPVKEAESRLLAILSTYLQPHPYPLTPDEIWTHILKIDSTIEKEDVVKVLDAYKDCFACTEDAEGGKTWKFVAFDTKF